MHADQPGAACLVLPLRGESLAAWLNRVSAMSNSYRKTAFTLSHSETCGSLSCARAHSGRRHALVGAGCAALTGSDAGKLSISPASSLRVHFGIGPGRLVGVGGVRSWGAGLNFLAMVSFPPMTNNAADFAVQFRLRLAKPVATLYQRRADRTTAGNALDLDPEHPKKPFLDVLGGQKRQRCPRSG